MEVVVVIELLSGDVRLFGIRVESRRVERG